MLPQEMFFWGQASAHDLIVLNRIQINCQNPVILPSGDSQAALNSFPLSWKENL